MTTLYMSDMLCVDFIDLRPCSSRSMEWKKCKNFRAKRISTNEVTLQNQGWGGLWAMAKAKHVSSLFSCVWLGLVGALLIFFYKFVNVLYNAFLSSIF
jgi:hypothetical protein